MVMCLPCLFITASADEGWQQVLAGEGITVYTRTVPGWPVKEFLGVGNVEASPEIINRVLDDANGFKEWMHECGDAALLERKGNDCLVAWVVTTAPWPVKSRDMVMESQTTMHTKDKIVRVFKPVNHASKPVSGKYVRMPRFEGSWILTAKGNVTEVRYQLKADPGGSLPDWLANMKVKDTPMGSLKGLRKQVMKPAYRQ